MWIAFERIKEKEKEKEKAFFIFMRRSTERKKK